MAEIGRIEPVQFPIGVLGQCRRFNGVRHRRVAPGNLAEEAEKEHEQDQHEEQDECGDPGGGPETRLPHPAEQGGPLWLNDFRRISAGLLLGFHQTSPSSRPLISADSHSGARP